MNKLFAIIAVFGLAFVFSACGSKTESASGATSKTTSDAAPATSKTDSAVAPAKSS
jgi:hypothetical protein